MRLANRVRTLRAAFPTCAGRVSRLVVGEYVPTAADRCRRCGGCHVLVIKKVIVHAPRDDAGGSAPR